MQRSLSAKPGLLANCLVICGVCLARSRRRSLWRRIGKLGVKVGSWGDNLVYLVILIWFHFSMVTRLRDDFKNMMMMTIINETDMTLKTKKKIVVSNMSLNLLDKIRLNETPQARESERYNWSSV